MPDAINVDLFGATVDPLVDGAKTSPDYLTDAIQTL